MSAIRTEMVSIPRPTLEALQETAIRLVQRTSESKNQATVELGIELEALVLQLAGAVATYDTLVALWGPGTQPKRPGTSSAPVAAVEVST